MSQKMQRQKVDSAEQKGQKNAKRLKWQKKRVRA